MIFPRDVQRPTWRGGPSLPPLFAFLACILLAWPSALSAADPFQLVVKTDLPGASGSTQFILGVNNGTPYDYTVSWGDGTSVSYVATGNPTHTYASAGTYTISIAENTPDRFPVIACGASGDQKKVLQIAQWGDVVWKSMYTAFSGCTNLTITATDHARANLMIVVSFQQAFQGCTSLTSFPAIDTSHVANFLYA